MSNALRVSGLVLRIGLLAAPLAAFAATAPTSCWLRDAAAPSPSTQYVVCEQGQIYITNDNGATWTMRQTGAQVDLHGLAFTDVNHGIIVGDSGTILLTDDAAKTWKPIASGTTEHLLAVSAMGTQAWAAGFDGVMIHSDDGGRTWRRQKTPSGQGIEGLYFADASHGWAVGWAGTILITANGGDSWREIKADAATWSLASVYFKDLKDGWAVGFSGELLRSRDGGETWKALKSPVPNWLKSVALDHAGHVWVSADDQLLLSEDGGETWRAVATGDNLFFCKLLPVNNALWAVGQLGVMQLTGAGTDWKPLESLVPAGVDIMSRLALDSGTATTASK